MREVRGAEKYRAVHSPARSAEGVIQSKMSAASRWRTPVSEDMIFIKVTTGENWNDGLSRKSEYFFRSSSLGWESLKARSLQTLPAKPMDGGSNSSLTCLKWKSLNFCSVGNSLLLLIHVVYTCTHTPVSLPTHCVFYSSSSMLFPSQVAYQFLNAVLCHQELPLTRYATLESAT